MLRGEVHWADLEPSVGVEANKTRPVLIVSNNGANAAAVTHRGVVTVVPLTSNTGVVHPFQAPVTVTDRESKAQVEQLRAISVDRLRGRIGLLDPEAMDRIDRALKVHLSL